MTWVSMSQSADEQSEQEAVQEGRSYAKLKIAAAKVVGFMMIVNDRGWFVKMFEVVMKARAMAYLGSIFMYQPFSRDCSRPPFQKI